MTDILHKFTNIFTDRGREINKVEHEASELIHDRLKGILQMMQTEPEGTKPSPVIRQQLEDLQHTIEELMVRVDKHADELPEYREVQHAMEVCKQSTLKKYIEQIPAMEELTPFATFGELYRNSQADMPEEQERHIQLFSMAVDALFNHPKFEKTLETKVLLKEDAMFYRCPDENSIERRNVVIFLAHYKDCKVANPALGENKVLENEIQELQAIMFFQDQKHLIEEEQGGMAESLTDHLDKWARYISTLSPEERRKKVALHKATESCAKAYKKFISSQPWV